jgi:hypothetical protein
MPVMLVGLALALDVFGAASGLGAVAQWGQIGIGVAFALFAAATFGMALVLTQHEASDLDGRLRTASTMGRWRCSRSPASPCKAAFTCRRPRSAGSVWPR